jgi:hypothetical protein
MTLRERPYRIEDIGGLYDLASIWVRGKYMSDERVGNGVGRMIVYMLGTGCQLLPGVNVGTYAER